MGMNTVSHYKDSAGKPQVVTALTPLPVTSGGALNLAYMPYSNATHNFYCEAAPGSALNAAVWRISRKTIVDSRIMWADGNDNFDNLATDLTTVAGLSYS